MAGGIRAGYPDVDLAECEFRALADRVAAKELTSQGMIRVRKAPTASHASWTQATTWVGGRAAWGGGAGVPVGLFSPPLLGAAVVGTAAVAVVGHFGGNKLTANNTPFQWGKQMASHLGGTRDRAMCRTSRPP